MRRVALIVCLCVLAACQSSWGHQPTCMDRPQGLIEVLTDIVWAPCGLLSTCLGLDTPVCRGPQTCRTTYPTCRQAYPPPCKCPDRAVRGDSSTRIKKSREQTTPRTSERTPPSVNIPKPSTERPTVQALPTPATPPKIQPVPQPPVVSEPIKPAPPVLPWPEEQATPAVGPVPRRHQEKPALPEKSQKIAEPPVSAAAPPPLTVETPRQQLPEGELVKPAPGHVAPSIPLEAPKIDEMKKPVKSRPKTPCGPVYQPCYPGYYYR